MRLQRVYLVSNVGNWSPGDYNGGVGHISAEMRSVAHWRVCKHTYVLISFYVRRCICIFTNIHNVLYASQMIVLGVWYVGHLKIYQFKYDSLTLTFQNTSNL